MATIEDQLLKIEDNGSKSIRGIKVVRESDYEFLIENVIHSLEDAVAYIDELGSSKRKGIDYDTVVFAIMKPRSRVVSTHRARNKKDHRKILDLAFKKQCFVYTAGVKKRNGKYYASLPWLIDWDSVDALYDELTGKPKVEFKNDDIKSVKKKKAKEREKPTIFCPFCDHKISSTPGRTLHVKSKHPKKLEEYQEWLKSLGKN